MAEQEVMQRTWGGLGPALALTYPSNPIAPPGLSFLSQKMGPLSHAWEGGPRQQMCTCFINWLW